MDTHENIIQSNYITILEQYPYMILIVSVIKKIRKPFNKDVYIF